jgi:DNA end-binding protein Ku
MLFSDEVVPDDELDLPREEVEVSPREEKMARQLIDSLSSDFEPEKYHDEYRERVLNLIEQKASGQEIVVEDATEEPTKVVDLMAALEASLAAVTGDGGKGDGGKGDAGKSGSGAKKDKTGG